MSHYEEMLEHAMKHKPTWLEGVKARVAGVTPKPTGNDDGDICAECGSAVDVHEGCEWEDGDICDRCLGDFARHARTDIPELIRRLEVAEMALDMISKHGECGNSCPWSRAMAIGASDCLTLIREEPK